MCNLQGRWNWCLVLLQIPKVFGLVQFFCVRAKIDLRIVQVPNFLCKTKRWILFSKFSYCAGTKSFGATLNAIQFLVWLKMFGSAQNILGPVEGQGISVPIQGAFNFLSSNNLPLFLKIILKASNLNLVLNSLLTSENTKLIIIQVWWTHILRLFLMRSKHYFFI